MIVEDEAEVIRRVFELTNQRYSKMEICKLFNEEGVLTPLQSMSRRQPMVGAAGISAFPMSARVIEKMGIAEDRTNHLLMHAIGANVSGQVASAVAGGIVLGFFM